MPNHFKNDVISFPSRIPKEFELDNYIDYDVQFDKAFLEPISVILRCMNWSAEKNQFEDQKINESYLSKEYFNGYQLPKLG